MVSRAKLSIAGACGLAVVTVLCWTADILGMRVFELLPHECRCLVFIHDGRYYHYAGFWVNFARLGIAFLPLLVLISWRRDWRFALGVTLADPGRTFRWTFLSCVACVVAVLGFVGSVEGWYWLIDERVPWKDYNVLDFSEPHQLYGMLWHMVVMCPLIEEVLYRGLPIPALERLGGSRVALIGSGLIWAALHCFVYELPIYLAPFYFVASVLTTLLFLGTRSLLPGLVLHAVFNLTFALTWYFVVLGGTW